MAITFPVRLFYESGFDQSHVEQVEGWFRRVPGPVTVEAVKKQVDIPHTNDGILRWEDIFNSLKQLREESNIPDDTFVFLLTKSPNENNWYATEDPRYMRNAFGHVADFRWVTSAPSSVITTHYILKAIFNALVSEAGIPWDSLWHQEPRGCFYDFCAAKQQLNLKLRTADICGDCMEAFRFCRIPEALLQQTVAIMESSRRLALNSAQFLEPEQLFDKWPFPVAITRHKAVQASNPLLRFLLLLDHFDSLVRYVYLAKEVLGGRRPVIEDRPTLGRWVYNLAGSARGERDLQQVVSIAKQEKIVRLRNEKRGHGWVSSTEESYKDDAARLEEVLSRIETELEPFLTSHQLVTVREIRVVDGHYEIEGERLNGSHVLHPRFSLSLDKDIRTYGIGSQDEVYLADNHMTRFSPMVPYIRTAVCPECRHPRILITDGGDQYIDTFVGHLVKL